MKSRLVTNTRVFAFILLTLSFVSCGDDDDSGDDNDDVADDSSDDATDDITDDTLTDDTVADDTSDDTVADDSMDDTADDTEEFPLGSGIFIAASQGFYPDEDEPIEEVLIFNVTAESRTRSGNKVKGMEMYETSIAFCPGIEAARDEPLITVENASNGKLFCGGDGVLRLLYYDSWQDAYVLIKYSGSDWTYDILLQTGILDRSDLQCALDDQDKMHCLYLDSETTQYMTDQSGEWITIQVKDEPAVGTLAVDRDTRLHSLYYRLNDAQQWGELVYATRFGGTWDERVVARRTSGIGFENSFENNVMALSDNDDAWIIYGMHRTVLFYCRYEIYQYSSLDPVIEQDSWYIDMLLPSLFIGSTGTESLTYTQHGCSEDSSNYPLILATRVIGSADPWQTQEIDSYGRLGRIAEDDEGKLHMAYIRSDSLMYAENTSGDWVTHEIY